MRAREGVILLLAGAMAAPAAAQRIFADGMETPYGFEFARLGTGAVGAGSDIALTWDAPGADECVASGVGPAAEFPFDGPRAPTVAVETVSLAQPGLYRFVLICRRGTQSASRLVDVVADAQPAGAPLPRLDLAREVAEAGESNSAVARLAAGSPAGTCTASHEGPGATAWPGPIAVGERRDVTAVAAGLHVLTLACGNASGVATVQRQLLVTEPPGCSAPGIRPSGWIARDVSWQQAFSAPDGSPVASWPNSVGFPVPLRVPRDGWTSIPFATEGPVTRVNLYLEMAQAIPSQGYPVASPVSGMFLAISPCRGDTRPPDPASADPTLGPHCRKFFNVGTFTLVWTGAPTAAVCVLQPGRRYFLTLLAADPGDGLQTGESTCLQPDAPLCDVSARQAAF